MIYEEVEIYTRKRAREHVLLSSWYFHSHLLEKKDKEPPTERKVKFFLTQALYRHRHPVILIM